ncbi:adenylate kinase family protein [Capsulimonas corticalis]|uniref:adenylate kinase family protein n=1 Tax=Capsulimonas corticalis TaxID=2219043 RepID=UPI001403FC0A|nr:nucleoside monophosphate kinase [Capsulimonas corticalis]
MLLGPPGSGKGTQGQKLADQLRVPRIATGDIIRDHIARRTTFGLKIEERIAAGDFAPDEDIIHYVSLRLAEPDAAAGYVLDGFPRNLNQARLFDATGSEETPAIDVVISLEIDEASLIERTAGRLICPKCGTVYQTHLQPPKRAGRCDRDEEMLVRRPEDDPGTMPHRLDVYHMSTLPLTQYYAQQGKLRPVDASGSPADVFHRILFALKDR